MQKQSSLSLVVDLAVNAQLTLSQVRASVTMDIEKQYLKLQLIRNHGDQVKAAEASGISPVELQHLLKNNDIDPTQFTHRQENQPQLKKVGDVE